MASLQKMFSPSMRRAEPCVQMVLRSLVICASSAVIRRLPRVIFTVPWQM